MPCTGTPIAYPPATPSLLRIQQQITPVEEAEASKDPPRLAKSYHTPQGYSPILPTLARGHRLTLENIL